MRSKIWITLLRGINVGGRNSLPMKELRELLGDLGFGNVQSYIQSGNCIFTSGKNDKEKMSAEISSAIEQQFGFSPDIFVLSLDEFDQAIEENPYKHAIDDPKSVHFYFLSKPAPEADLAALEEFSKTNEAFHLTEKVLYIYAPDGIGRSKLVAKIPKFVLVRMTARNLRTIMKIEEMTQKSK